MKGVILDEGFQYYTDMNAILLPFEEYIVQHNWFITSCECNHYPDDRIGNINKDYDWLSGMELMGIIKSYDIQFVWAVFSAFPQEIPLDQITKYGLPYADGYTGFWKNPISIQHPLAVTEIVPWDSSLVLLISKEDELVRKFINHFPLSIDLEKYNTEG